VTAKKRTLIVGHGGREAALASEMARHSEVHAFIGHANPTICDVVASSGGSFQFGDVCSPRDVARFANEVAVDIAMVSSDNPLEAGVVDALVASGVATVGPTRAGAEIEWNKIFCREVIEEIAPEANPIHSIARSVEEVSSAVEYVASIGGPVVVKPIGLAGGKGVKVVGPHLVDNAEAVAYANDVVTSGRHGGAVVIEERIEAPEFTIQAITDGKEVVFPPATYDYPYRFEGDRGPGTGGMGSCTLRGGLLPFLDRESYDKACAIVAQVIEYLAAHGREFSGCMNAGFFATRGGVKVIELNARFGDPEGINIMSLFSGNWVEVMESIWSRSLRSTDVDLADESSVVTYLVSPEYAISTGVRHEFTVDVDAIEAAGASVRFSSAQETGPQRYETVGTSRAVAITARSPEIDTARKTVADAISAGVRGDLEWRSDIGAFPTGTGDHAHVMRP
jgi:phosphoribosylamine--glycine ligase